MRGHLFLPIGKFRKSKRQNKRRFCFSTYFSESFTNVIPTMNLLCPYGLLCSPVGVLKVSEVTPFPSSSSCASVGDPWLQNSGGSRSGVQHGAAVQAVSRGVTQGTPFPPDLSRLPHLERICCFNDISPEWNTDHLSAANDDICLLTSQDQHSEARNLFSPLKGNCIKTKFTVNCWLLKPKAGSARYPFH